jgi:zinc transport system ATP-binding protein
MRRDAPVILEFNKVDFSYGPVQVLEGASFHIHAGEFVALVGPNGAGKSTILKLILALENPNKGNITLFGSSPHASREKIGYVPQLITYDPAFPSRWRRWLGLGESPPLRAAILQRTNKPLNRLLSKWTSVTWLNAPTEPSLGVSDAVCW